MATTPTGIKITGLTDIGNAISPNTLLPVVNLTGTDITQKANIQITGNLILAGAGSANFVPARLANLAYSVVNSAQPNITSVGTLTNLIASGNITGNYIKGNGSQLTGIIASGGTANILANGTSNINIPIANGNITMSSNSHANVVVVNGTNVFVNGTLLPTQITSNTIASNNYGNISVSAGASSWIFTNSGNLVLPGNTFTVNYANGSQVVLGGGGNANTGNIRFDNTFIYSVNNADIWIDPSDDNGNTGYINVPGPTNANTNPLVVENQMEGNVDIRSNNNTWTFGADSNLYAPGNIVGLASANFVVYANAGVHEFTFADDGTFYAPDNVVLSGTSISIGPGSNTLTGINNAVFIASSNSTAYIQAALTNVSDIGSADWAAYGHRGDDNGGWIDMGFNSSGYSGTDYTITGPGDGSILVESYYDGQSPGGRGGNLILATGGQGTVSDIIFGTGGFLAVNEFGRISNANNTLELTRPGAQIRFPNDSYLGSIEGPSTFGLLANSNASIVLETSHYDGATTTGYSWVFDDAGVLTVPGNISIDTGVDGNINSNGNINLTAVGNVYITSKQHTFNFDSDTVGRLIMPPSGIIASDSNVGNGLNIFVGNTTTEIGNNWNFGTSGIVTLPNNNYIETTDANLKVGSQGEVVVRSNAATGLGTRGWVFGADGTLNLPDSVSAGNAIIQTTSAINIQVNSNAHNWTFGADGNLHTPQGGYIGPAGVKGDGTMITGGYGNLTSLTSYYSNGFYSGCVSAYPDGNVLITTYPGSGSNVWTFGVDGNLTVPGTINTGTHSIVGAEGILNLNDDSCITLTGVNNSVLIQTTTNTADPATYKSWAFGTDGNLTLPTNGNLVFAGNLVFSSGAIFGGKLGDSLETNGYAIEGGSYAGSSLLIGTTAGGQGIYANNNRGGNFQINTGTGGTISNTWDFNNDGNLSMPGNVTVNGNVSANNISTSGSGGNITGANVITANTFVGNGGNLTHVVTTANTAYNIVRETPVNLDNISLQVASNGVPQISAVTSNISTYWSVVAVLTGGNASSTNTGSTANVGVWTNISTDTLGSGGDTITAVIQDQTGGHVYRGTFIQTAGPGNASVMIERLM